MKNSVTLAASLVLAVMTFFTACNLTDDGKDTVVRVATEFTVDMFEELNEARNFQFRIKTIEPQTCINNTINFTSNRLLSLLSLRLNEIEAAPDCIAGMEPVSANAAFGYLSNGSYDVQINLKNTVVNEGILQVTKDAYLLSMSTEDGYELMRTELRRIPNNFIWGYVGFQDKNQAGPIAGAFIQDLENITNKGNLVKGNYSYFNIDDNRMAVLRTPPPFPYFTTFNRQIDGNIDAIKTLLEEYRSGPNADLMEIKLFTWDGKIL